MRPHQKLRHWRLHTVQLTIAELSEKTGYSFGRIYEFERGEKNQNGLERFRLVCAGVFGAPGWDWG